MTRAAWILCSVLLVASGCDDGSSVDAGGGGTDAGGGGTDAGGGGTDAGGGDVEVARCQAASAALAAACPTDGDRTCHVGEYADFCQADARPDLFADALECLLAMSGASGCRTFSDPSGADTCVDAVYDGFSSPDVDAIAARAEAVCSSSPMVVPQRTEPPLFALGTAQLDALQTCLDAAADCDAVGACTEVAAGDIFACYGP